MQVYSIPISRPIKRVITGCWDAVLLGASLVFSYGLSGAAFFQQEQKTLLFLAVALLLSLLAFIRVGLYRILVLYMGAAIESSDRPMRHDCYLYSGCGLQSFFGAGRGASSDIANILDASAVDDGRLKAARQISDN